MLRQHGVRWLKGLMACSLALAMPLLTPPAMSPLSPQAAHADLPGGSISIQLPREPQNLNPLNEADSASLNVLSFVLRGLLTVDDHGILRPDIAYKVPTPENFGVVITPSGEMKVTYELRRDVYWHDGKRFTGDDVKFTWEAMKDARLLAQWPERDPQVQAGYDKITRIEVLNPTTIEVYFKEPYPAYALLFQYVLPKHLFGPLTPISKDHYFWKKPIGTGPFIFKEWIPGDRITLEYNPRYHVARAYLDQVVFTFGTAHPNRLKAIREGSVLAVTDISPEVAKQFKNDPQFEVVSSKTAAIDHLDFNLSQPPLNNLSLRQALIQAVDRQRLNDEVFGGWAHLAESDQTDSSWAYNPRTEELYSYDLDSAKNALKTAGYANGLQLTLVKAAGNVSHDRIAQYLVDSYKKMGVKLRVETLASTAFWDRLRSGKFEIALYAWQTPPEADLFSRWHSMQFPPTGTNYTRLENTDVDIWLERHVTSMRTPARKVAARQAEGRIAELAPSLPLIYHPRLSVVNKKLFNFKPSPWLSNDGWNSASWWLDN